MRRLSAILGLIAMLLALSVPVTAFAAASCPETSMAMPEGTEPCAGPDLSCLAPCLASAKCQSQCPSNLPMVMAIAPDVTMPCHIALFDAAVNEQPPDTSSPVDSPPPRI